MESLFYSEAAWVEYREALAWEAMPHGARVEAAVRDHARAAGAEDPGRPWILTPFDTWERNPYYTGPPAIHPEASAEEWEAHFELLDAAWLAHAID